MPGMLPRAPQNEPEADHEEDTDVHSVETRDETPATLELENEEVAPPLPSNRPPPLPSSSSSLPPLRSLPTPSEESAAALPPLPPGRPIPATQDVTHFVDEPFELHDLDQEDLKLEESTPPSPVVPRLSSLPSSPSQRPQIPASKRDSVASYRSYGSELGSPVVGGAGLLGIDIPTGAMTVPDQESVPALPQKSEAVPSQSGSDRAAPPPSLAPSQTDLIHFSSTIGTQIFATAHSQKNSKQTSTEAFLDMCFSRATDPRPPSGFSYGIAILSVSIASEVKSSKPIVTQLDEPRAGDIAVFFDTKFKHGLTTTKVGGSDTPHRGVVESWDAKKRKVKLLQVQGNGIEEVGYRIEDLKAGLLKVNFADFELREYAHNIHADSTSLDLPGGTQVLLKCGVIFSRSFFVLCSIMFLLTILVKFILQNFAFQHPRIKRFIRNASSLLLLANVSRFHSCDASYPRLPPVFSNASVATDL